MILAIPVWHNRIAPVFNTAHRVLLYKESSSGVELYEEIELPYESVQLKVTRLIELKIELLICGAIPFRFEQLFEMNGIEVIPFTAGDVLEVISAYRRKELDKPEFKMPGCRNGRVQGKRCRYHSDNNKGEI